jgi:GNAT superfamily N-acetyltransferase
MDRLLDVLLAAASGRFPPAEGAVEVVAAPRGARAAVVAFTAHSIVAADVDPALVRRHLPDADPGAPSSVPFLAWLGEQVGGVVGSLDVVLAGAPSDPEAGPELEPIATPAHARVDRALAHRSEVSVFADPERRGLVTIGRGLAGRQEVSMEVEPGARRTGLGIELALAARRFATPEDPVFAQVAPGNVASLRAFLRAGYRPIGSEVLVTDS